MSLSVPVPTINANDETVLVVRWHVAEGAEVTAGEPLVDVETTKSVATIDAPASGRLRRMVEEGAEIAVGAELARLEWAEAAVAALGAAVEAVLSDADTGRNACATSATPAGAQAPVDAVAGAARLSREAARLAAERGLDAAAPFPGAAGLVTARRLRAELGEVLATPDAGAPAVVAEGRRERTPPDKRAEIAALRAGTAEGLRSSLTMYFDSAPVRAALGAERGLLAHILAEAARLVAARPAFAAWHDAGATVYHDAVHLGVAIDLGEGLRVVTLRDAAAADAAELEARLAERVLDCAERRLAPEDASGSTFTVTDLSALDVLHFEPLLNARQSAILGVGGDARLPGWPVSLTLAFDHRVLTGRQAAEFLRELRARLEGLAVGSEPAAGAMTGAMDNVVATDVEVRIEAPECDRCGVAVGEYYARFGRAGLMQNYTRADGTTGRVCHACVALG